MHFLNVNWFYKSNLPKIQNITESNTNNGEKRVGSRRGRDNLQQKKKTEYVDKNF